MYIIEFKDGSVKEFETLRGADLRGAYLEGAYLRDADLEGVDLRGAYLRGVDLRGVNLSGADLKDAYLGGVDLRGADLRGVDLRGAILRGVNLRGAYVDNTAIITFQLGKHFGFYHEGLVVIGCQRHSLDYWLENYMRLGRKNGYTSKQILAYSLQLKLLKALEENDR